MKKYLGISVLIIFLSGCTESSTSEVESKNFEGSYQDLYVPTFASVVNVGTSRNGTGNVFVRHNPSSGERAIEVYPGSIYEPDMPDKLKEGYTAEIKLEQVNRHAEQAKEIYSISTTNLEDAKVQIPDEPGKLYRYSIKVRNAKNELKDTRYDPLFTTFEDYNMAMNVMKEYYKHNEKITFIIENWGPNHVSYSTDWEVYKKKNDEWIEVKRQVSTGGFMEPLLIPTAWSMEYLNIDQDAELLMPSENISLILEGYDLEKGDYKLALKAGSAKHVFTLEDNFQVK
jgi:hypothetical protein